MSASGGTKAIIAALLANAGIAVAKFVGYLVTGSSSMLAEAVHSVADTSNQALLLLGGKRAQRAATAEHPFGYGRDRYFYSFVVALLLFSLGSVFALYEGIHKLESHEPLTSPLVAVIILVVAVALEGYSFRTAIKESRPLKGGSTWWQFIRQSKSPELPVVLLEDFGALIGLVLALLGVGLTLLTGNAVFDALGTIAIGVLLGVIAIILIVEMKSLLIGEGAAPPVLARIVGAIEDGGPVQRVIHIRTQYLGPEELLVAAKVALQPVRERRGRRARHRRGGAAGPRRRAGGPADLPRTRPRPVGRPRLKRHPTAGVAVLAPSGSFRQAPGGPARAARTLAGRGGGLPVAGRRRGMSGGGPVASERRRRAVFAVMLGLAILGAVVVMASVLVENMTARVVLQVAGLVTCSAASVAVVLTVRRWGAADDFWWLDSDSATDPAEPTIGRDSARTPGGDTDR